MDVHFGFQQQRPLLLPTGYSMRLEIKPRSLRGRLPARPGIKGPVPKGFDPHLLLRLQKTFLQLRRARGETRRWWLLLGDDASRFPTPHVGRGQVALRFRDGSKLLFGFLNFFFCLFFDRSECPSSSSSKDRFPRTLFSVPLLPFSLHISFGLKGLESL